MKSILPNKQGSPIFILLFSLIITGSSGAIIKYVQAPGIATAFFRMAIGSVTASVPFFIYYFRFRPVFCRKAVWFSIAAGVCFGIDIALWSTGVVMSTASIPTVAANLAPIWVGIGSMLIFKEKRSKVFWFGLVLAVLGVLLLMDLSKQGSNYVIGTTLGFIAGLLYGGYYLFTQPARNRINTISFLFINTTAAAVVLCGCMFFFKIPFFVYSAQTYWIYIIYGVIIQVVGWYMISYVQGILPATLVSPVLLGQPVITAVLSYYFLDEVFSNWQLVGGLIVFVGIYIVHFSRRYN